MKIYRYKDIEYKTESSLRKAIWFKERLALPKMNEEQWKEFGVEIYDKEPEITEEELARQVRAKRDSLLRKSDIYFVSDYPISSASLEQVKAYRQALRDLPEDSGFPSNVTWPELPEITAKVSYV